MNEANLGRLLSRAEAAAIVRSIMTATGTPSAVWDPHGRKLLDVSDGPGDAPQQKHAVLCDGKVAGWVSGGEQAEPVAILLSHLLTEESDKEELLDEILGLYRELNLIFDLSGKLAPALEPETVAGTVLREASRVIKATGGAVVLLAGAQIRRSLATMGHDISPVWVGARAEIVNDVRQDPRFAGGSESIRSLICAPLTGKNEPIGTVLLASQAPVTYTAAELKLLNSLALLATPSMESALLYERKLQEAREGEERLRRQVEDIVFEVDEATLKEKVAEITGAEYYQRLRNLSDTLRRIARSPSAE